MATARSPRSPAEVVAAPAHLQDLADHPGRIERMHGRGERGGLRGIPQDSREVTHPTTAGRFVADYSIVAAEQAANYASGVL